MPNTIRPEPIHGRCGSGSVSVPASAARRSRKFAASCTPVSASSDRAPVTRNSGHTPAMSASAISRADRRFATRSPAISRSIDVSPSCSAWRAAISPAKVASNPSSISRRTKGISRVRMWPRYGLLPHTAPISARPGSESAKASAQPRVSASAAAACWRQRSIPSAACAASKGFGKGAGNGMGLDMGTVFPAQNMCRKLHASGENVNRADSRAFSRLHGAR